MKNEKWYTCSDGFNYLEQRTGALSDHVQQLRASLFTDLGGDDISILDFGCGTGGVLQRIAASKRFGVEIGTEAAKTARSRGITVKNSLEDMHDAYVDVAISFHAIEHVDDPHSIIADIGRVVKPEGRIRLVVPCEMPLLIHQRTWKPNHDRHLYTWTPLLFGNLAYRVGLTDIKVRIEPMPTGSRIVRWFKLIPPIARTVHLIMSLRSNSMNVILDASPPKT